MLACSASPPRPPGQSLDRSSRHRLKRFSQSASGRSADALDQPDQGRAAGHALGLIGLDVAASQADLWLIGSLALVAG